MVEKDAGAAFADAFPIEDDTILAAREASEHFGVEPVSPALGAALAVAAAGRPARTIIELGTGVGVSGLWLLKGAPQAQLTTIDVDLDQHQMARTIFGGAGYPPKQLRFITGRAEDLLPRMNEGSYDVVFVDMGHDRVASVVDSALQLARPGGSVLVARVLQGGKVANPARRDRVTAAYRELLKTVKERADVLTSLVPVGDGLLHLVRLESTDSGAGTDR